MKLNEFFGRLSRSPNPSTAESDHAAQSLRGSMPPDPLSEPEPGSAALETRNNPVLKLDAPQMIRGRDAVADIQQKAYQRIQRLHIDRRSVVSRFAELRADGRQAEKAALVRMFKGLDLQLQKQEQFHADLVNWRQLLDNLLMTHEFAVLREQVKAGALAGMHLSALRELLDVASACEMDERTHVTDLLQDQQRNDIDAALQTQAEYAEAEHELNQLSEPEYQELVDAKMEPLEDLAEQVERSLSEAHRSANKTSTAQQAPRRANEKS